MTDMSIPVWPEIVTVLDDRRLADLRSDVHPYWRRDGKGLAPGLYVAVRQPAGFNVDAEFRGPFRRAEEADAAMTKLAASIQRRQRYWRASEHRANPYLRALTSPSCRE
jgi:hypothetical protein